jgi:PDDEXK-like domain of unknown function (DUF3799)
MNIGDQVWWRHTADWLNVGTVTEVGDEQTAVTVGSDTVYVSNDILLPVADIPVGRWRGIPDTVYHRLLGLSASGAKLLVPPSCPAKFKEQRDNPPPSNAVFDLGKAVHGLVLGEGAPLQIIDAKDWRSKAASEARNEAYAAGVIPILVGDFAQIKAMADAVLAHPMASGIIGEGLGEAEVSLLTDDPTTGVRLKARPDWSATIGGRLWLVDLKTTVTAEPKAFARRAADYRYHLQAAWYVQVAALLELDPQAAFVFIAVEKEPPYLVSVTEWDGEAMQEGALLMRQAIDTYARCMESDFWGGYFEGITPMYLPRWAFGAQESIGDVLEMK